MSEYDNTNRGVLFKNDRKNGNERAPDYKGTMNVDGVEHWLSGWVRKSKAGATFLSLSLGDPKEQQTPPLSQDAQRRQGGGPAPTVPDDDIPFGF